MTNYELKIISMDEVSKNKALKQYDLNGEKVVGCYENEAFMLRFKNNTWNKISVKISLDGLNVLNGKLANTDINDDMFVIQPYQTLDLKAWPETNKGGSEFVFGKTEDSVAINTNGNKTGIGHIAAAIFIEKVEVGQWYSQFRGKTNQQMIAPTITWIAPTFTPTFTPPFDITCKNNQTGTTIPTFDTINYNSQCIASSNSMNIYSCNAIAFNGPAVGAGEYTAQEITKVAGLNKPVLSEIVSIKYEWWTSLRSKIRQLKDIPINPAFPGDQQVTKMIDLKSTPRKKKNKISKETKYPELNRFG